MQPETLEHSTRDSSLSSALHFLNEIPLPLANTQRGRERGGGRSVAAKEKTLFFLLFFPKCQRVERRSFGRWSLDGVKTFVYLLDILSLLHTRRS